MFTVVPVWRLYPIQIVLNAENHLINVRVCLVASSSKSETSMRLNSNDLIVLLIGLVQKTFLPPCDHAGNTEELGRLQRENAKLKQDNEALIQARDLLAAQAKRATDGLTKEKATAQQLRSSLSALQSELNSLSSCLPQLSPAILNHTCPVLQTPPSTGSSASSVRSQSTNQETYVAGAVTSTPVSGTQCVAKQAANRRSVRTSKNRSSTCRATPPVPVTPSPVSEGGAGSISGCMVTRQASIQDQNPLRPVKVASDPYPRAPVASITSSGCSDGGAHGDWSYRGSNGYVRQYKCGRCLCRFQEHKMKDQEGVLVWCKY